MWYELLRPLCRHAREVAGSSSDLEAVVFYVARWCQKETAAAEPDLASFAEDDLAEIAARVVANLEEDGARVDLLVAGDAAAWTDLRRLLWSSAHPRAGAAAGEYADEALQKIAVVLLTGVPPSRAAGQLADDLDGPRNEYVFSAPFPHWARTVVINLVLDDRRRRERGRAGPQPRAPAQQPCLDAATLERAHDALPALLDAIRGLPPVQRSVMVWTLARSDLDRAVTDRLLQLAADMFGETGRGIVSSDRDIAARLGTTPRLVAANRSVARCKLARRDPLWELLLDVLLPHRSTRPARKEEPDD